MKVYFRLRIRIQDRTTTRHKLKAKKEKKEFFKRKVDIKKKLVEIRKMNEWRFLEKKFQFSDGVGIIIVLITPCCTTTPGLSLDLNPV